MSFDTPAAARLAAIKAIRSTDMAVVFCIGLQILKRSDGKFDARIHVENAEGDFDPKIFSKFRVKYHTFVDLPEAKSATRQVGGAVKRPVKAGSVKRVWEICDQLKERKAIIAACIAEGINPSTAATQYGAWKRSQ